MDDLSKPLVRANLEYHELHDGGVVCDTSADKIYTLNLTAAYVWNCLDGSNSVRLIASKLHQQANVPAKRALEDVREAIASFRSEGLLDSE